MSVSKSKNLERKLDNFAKEAKHRIMFGIFTMGNLGFVFFRSLEDPEKIGKLKFYFSTTSNN